MRLRDQKDHRYRKCSHVVFVEPCSDGLDFFLTLLWDTGQWRPQRCAGPPDLQTLVFGKQRELFRLLFLAEFGVDGLGHFVEYGPVVRGCWLISLLKRV